MTNPLCLDSPSELQDTADELFASAEMYMRLGKMRLAWLKYTAYIASMDKSNFWIYEPTIDTARMGRAHLQLGHCARWGLKATTVNREVSRFHYSKAAHHFNCVEAGVHLVQDSNRNRVMLPAIRELLLAQGCRHRNVFAVWMVYYDYADGSWSNLIGNSDPHIAAIPELHDNNTHPNDPVLLLCEPKPNVGETTNRQSPSQYWDEMKAERVKTRSVMFDAMGKESMDDVAGFLVELMLDVKRRALTGRDAVAAYVYGVYARYLNREIDAKLMDELQLKHGFGMNYISKKVENKTETRDKQMDTDVGC